MPDSQNTCGCCGSNTTEEGRLTIIAEPAPVPIGCQLLPPSSLAKRPCLATPAINVFAPGFATTMVRSPHSEAMPARLEVTLAQAAGGALPVPPMFPLPP